MNAAAAQLQNALTAALACYEQWERPLRTYRGKHGRRLGGDGMSWEEFDRNLGELETSLRAEWDPSAVLHPLFERLCAEYAASDDAGRKRIREFAARQQKLGELLWRYANSLARQVAGERCEPLVMRALAAVSIENCACDVRDIMMTLADLFVAAETAGVDPARLFAKAADWSTDERTSGQCESVARMLREFETYSVLAARRAEPGPYNGPT